jgi:antirestriction protein ArdC
MTRGWESPSINSLITKRIIKMLRNNIVPWRNCFDTIYTPINLVSKREYRGINRFLLGFAGHTDNCFLTHKQLTSLGATINKKQKPKFTIFNDKASYEIYSVEQISFSNSPSKNLIFSSLNNTDISKVINKIYSRRRNLPRAIENCSSDSYSYKNDKIKMKSILSFPNVEEYYFTLFKNLILATGHPKRLNRNSIKMLDKPNNYNYYLEQLTSEMSLTILMSIFALYNKTLIKNKKSYINYWIKILKKYNNILLESAKNAEKVVDYLVGKWYKTEDYFALEDKKSIKESLKKATEKLKKATEEQRMAFTFDSIYNSLLDSTGAFARINEQPALEQRPYVFSSND